MNRFSMRLLAGGLCVWLLLQPMLTAAEGLRLEPTTGGAGGASLAAAANGVPLVQIAKPTSGGVSHNAFAEFNIDERGLIFNNSQVLIRTELGGLVNGNPQLTDGSARIILSEVTGGGPTAIAGYGEVAGAAADLVIANPYGISVNGGGFLNTPRVSLTTGIPLWQEDRLSGFRVEDGQITVTGAGLNASNLEQLDLVSRSFGSDAPLYAEDLNLILGRNLVERDSLAVTPLPEAGADRPQLAVDVSQLGGMYAGRIHLLASENGVGVRLAGEMAAGAGGLTLTGAGRLELQGAVAAVESAQIRGGGLVEVDGSLHAGRRLAIESTELAVATTGDVQVGNPARSDADLQIATGTLRNAGTLLSSGELQVQASQEALNDGGIHAGGKLTLATARLSNTGGAMSAAGELEVTTDGLIDNSSGEMVASSMRLSAGAEGLRNRQGVLAAGQSLLIASAGTLDNTNGAIASHGDGRLVIAAANQVIENQAGTVEAAGDAEITARELVGSGSVASNGELRLSLDNLHHVGRLEAGGELRLDIDQQLVVAADRSLLAADDLRIAAGTVDNQGVLSAGRNLVLRAETFANGGLAAAGAGGTLAIDWLNNAPGGLLLGLEGLTIAGLEDGLPAELVVNDRGTIESWSGDLEIAARRLENLGDEPLVERTDYVEETGWQRVSLTWKENTITTGYRESATPGERQGRILAGRDLRIQAGELRNSYSLISAARDLQLGGERLTNSGRDLVDHYEQVVEREEYTKYCEKVLGFCANVVYRWEPRAPLLEGPFEIVTGGVHATIEAGNDLVAGFSTTIDNGAVRDHVTLAATDAPNLPTVSDPVATDFSWSFPELTVLDSGLFQRAPADHGYLIETRPEFSHFDGYVNSGYLLAELGYDPEALPLRLGDGFVETRLVRDQLLRQGGSRLSADSSGGDAGRFRELMENGARLAEPLELTLGIELSAGQVARLSHDIVWLVEDEVLGERVLVPRVYLAAGDPDLAGGSRIEAGGDLLLVSGGSLLGSGRFAAGEDLLMSGEDLALIDGSVAADGLALLIGGQKMSLQGVAVTADRIDLQSAGAIELERRRTTSETNFSRSEALGRATRLEGSRSVTLEGTDLRLAGAELSSGSLELRAEHDLAIEASGRSMASRARHDRLELTEQTASSLLADEVRLAAGRDLAVTGSSIRATGEARLSAGGQLTVSAAEKTRESHYRRRDRGLFSSRTRTVEESDRTLLASRIEAGELLQLEAGTVTAGDLTVTAGQLASGGDLLLAAGGDDRDGDINLLAGESERRRYAESVNSGIGVWFDDGALSFAKKETLRQTGQTRTSEESLVTAAGTLEMTAARDTTLVGSTAVADTIVVASGRDANLLSALHRSAASEQREDQRLGISFSSDQDGAGFFAGVEKERLGSDRTSDQVAESALVAGDSLQITTGGSILTVGSDLVAGEDLTLTAGEQVKTLAGFSRDELRELHEMLQIGFSSRLQHNLGSTVEAVDSVADSGNALTAVSRGLRATDAVAAVAQPSLSVHVGTTATRSEARVDESTARASSLLAGRDLEIVAGTAIDSEGTLIGAGRDLSMTAEEIRLRAAKNRRTINEEQSSFQAGLTLSGSASSASLGAGFSGAGSDLDEVSESSSAGELTAGRDVRLVARGDLALEGVQGTAGRDMLLRAGDDLIITPAVTENRSGFDAHNFGAEVGVGIGLTTTGSQFGIYGSVSGGQEELDREGTHTAHTRLQAGGNLELEAGRDARISGASIEAETLRARVGGDLTVASVADTGLADGSSWNASATLGTGGGGLSGGLGDTRGSTDWISEQTVLRGRQQVAVEVEGHTRLDAAMIVADSGDLLLETGSFAASDFTGHDRETSRSIGGGISRSFEGDDASATGATAGSNRQETDAGSWSGDASFSERDREQMVRATVGAGEIIVRDDERTGRDSLAALNRNEDLAYVVTRDEESSFELYASANSTKRIAAAVEEPSAVLGQAAAVKEALADYGNLVKGATKNWQELEDQARKDERLGTLPGSLLGTVNDTLDTVGGVTGGVMPSVENRAGLSSQVPVLLTDRMEAYKVKALVKQDPETREIFLQSYGYEELDLNDPQQLESLNQFSTYVAVNGMKNGLEDAIRNGVMQTGAKDFVQLYNPSHGFVGDLLESAWDKTVGYIVPTGAARDLQRFIEDSDDAKLAFSVASHSQGTLLTWRALEGQELNKYWKFQSFGAPVNQRDLAEAIDKARADDKGLYVNFSGNRNDPVATVLGRNARSPWEFFTGVLSMPSLFGSESPHSNYFCQPGFCAGTQPGLEEMRASFQPPVKIELK